MLVKSLFVGSRYLFALFKVLDAVRQTGIKIKDLKPIYNMNFKDFSAALSIFLLLGVFFGFFGFYFISHTGGHTCPLALISGFKCLLAGNSGSLNFALFHLREVRSLFQSTFVLSIIFSLFLAGLFFSAVYICLRFARSDKKNGRLEKNELNFLEEKIKFLFFKTFYKWLSLRNKIIPDSHFLDRRFAVY